MQVGLWHIAESLTKDRPKRAGVQFCMGWDREGLPRTIGEHTAELYMAAALGNLLKTERGENLDDLIT
jgi:hypothetical protein